MSWHNTPRPLRMSLEYFSYQRQGENRQAVALHPDDPNWLAASWVPKTGLAHMVLKDRVRVLFPLCHLDLHCGNMLFDKEFNITGIIDRSRAPLEQLPVPPEPATLPASSDEKNRPMIG